MTQERGMGPSGTVAYGDDGEHRIPISSTSGPIELDVSNSSGEVAIRADDGPDAIVRFSKNANHGNDSELVIDVRGNRIKIEPRGGGGLGGFRKRDHLDVDALIAGALDGGGLGRFRKRDRGSFDIAVELPRERLADGSARVRIRTASGEVEIVDVPGEVRVNTASGDAHVVSADGAVTAQTASGDVTLVRPRGQITAHTASGDIHVEDGVLSRFAIATASGDTRLTGTLVGNDASKVEAVSGDAWLKLAAPAIAELRYTTVSGDASITGPWQKVASRTWAMGDGGGPTISVKTVSGDLHIEGIQSQPAAETEPVRQAAAGGDTAPFATEPVISTPPPPPTPPTPPRPEMPSASDANTHSGAVDTLVPDAAGSPLDEAERLSVLQALERGEIDIEEALSRLEEVDEPNGA